jgi:hypothetical protein
MRPEVVLTHEFVEFIPEKLREGTLYVCIPFATVVHRCCCGCGREVVTPLSPTDWKLTFDGASVSLDPSIGNWNFPCQSHYWIQHNRVRWAGRWSKDEIEAGRAADALAKARHFGGEAAKPELPAPAPKVGAEPDAGASVGTPVGTSQKMRGWRKLFSWLFEG